MITVVRLLSTVSQSIFGYSNLNSQAAIEAASVLASGSLNSFSFILDRFFVPLSSFTSGIQGSVIEFCSRSKLSLILCNSLDNKVNWILKRTIEIKYRYR